MEIALESIKNILQFQRYKTISKYMKVWFGKTLKAEMAPHVVPHIRNETL